MRFLRYPSYKASGFDWLGDVPTHWEIVPLKRRCLQSALYGANIPAEEYLSTSEGVRFLRTTDIDDLGELQPGGVFIDRDLARGYLLNDGDLLLSRSGTIGRAFRFSAGRHPESAYAGYLVRFIPSRHLNSKFAFYFTKSTSFRDWLDTQVIASTIGNVNGQKYAQCLLPLPDRPEQDVIVRFLDRETAKLETLLAQKRALIERLKEKRTALISLTVTGGLPPDAAAAAGLDPAPKLEASGVEWLGDIPAHWKVTRLKYASSRIVDCPHETPMYADDGEYPVIRTADLRQGRLDLSAAYRVDADEYHKRIRREPLIHHDIVYGREGERWGLAALIPPSPAVCLGQRMMQFRAARHFDAAFLMWHLNAASVYKQGSVDTVGATSPHVNVETIRNYWLAEPPLHEQRAIARFLDNETARLDLMMSKVELAIERLQEYRSALITMAVTGGIDIRGQAA